MINVEQIALYFKAVSGSIKFQLSAALAFGAALVLLWIKKGSELQILLTILFLFPIFMFFGTLIEKIFLFLKNETQRKRDWTNLTPEECNSIQHYVNNNTKTQYVLINNGTYRDSGTINPLIHKGILYIASDVSEYRGNDFMSMNQYYPINIQDRAFEFFKKNFVKGVGK